MIRDRKLRNLAYSKKTDYNRIKVHNRTNITIPTDVLEISEFGKNRGVGSETDLSSSVIAELEKLLIKFEKKPAKTVSK